MLGGRGMKPSAKVVQLFHKSPEDFNKNTMSDFSGRFYCFSFSPKTVLNEVLNFRKAMALSFFLGQLLSDKPTIKSP